MARFNRRVVRGLEGHPLERKMAKAFTAAAFKHGNGREFFGRSGARGLMVIPKGWVVFNTGWTWSIPEVLVKEAERVGIDADMFSELFCKARFRGRDSGRAVISDDGHAYNFASGEDLGPVVESPHGDRVCLGEGVCTLDGPHLPATV